MGASAVLVNTAIAQAQDPQLDGAGLPQGSGSWQGSLRGGTHPRDGLLPKPAVPPPMCPSRWLQTRTVGRSSYTILCLVTDRAARREAALEAAVVAAVEGGVDMVQLRKEGLAGARSAGGGAAAEAGDRGPRATYRQRAG